MHLELILYFQKIGPQTLYFYNWDLTFENCSNLPTSKKFGCICVAIPWSIVCSLSVGPELTRIFKKGPKCRSFKSLGFKLSTKEKIWVLCAIAIKPHIFFYRKNFAEAVFGFLDPNTNYKYIWMICQNNLQSKPQNVAYRKKLIYIELVSEFKLDTIKFLIFSIISFTREL